MRNVMVDIEALGTAPGSVVISIGACYFNCVDKFKLNIEVFDSLMWGLKVDHRTCKWWSKQSTAAIMNATLLPSPKPLPYVLNRFREFIAMDDYIWAKGPDFDLVMIQELYRVVGESIPWTFRNTRDVRTIMHLAKQKTGERVEVPRDEDLIQHDALGDAIYQVKVVEECAKRLGIKI